MKPLLKLCASPRRRPTKLSPGIILTTGPPRPVQHLRGIRGDGMQSRLAALLMGFALPPTITAIDAPLT
jgi:hypothetical protein